MKYILSISLLAFFAALGPVAASLKKSKKSKKSDSNKRNLHQFQDDFKYPDDMPPPPQMWVEGFASRLHAQNIQKYETPIQVWQTWRLDQTMWNCIAHYHPTALNAITKAEPILRAPEKYHTSEARALCMIHAVNKLIPELVPISADLISDWLDDLGLDSSIMSDEEAAQLATVDGNPTPRVIGSLVAGEVIQDMQDDGWNYKGYNTPTGGNTCTANCRPFGDTHGYVPKNSPWEITDPHAWQPLIESDDNGFFYAQEHVTPHIGFDAKPVILTRAELDETKIPDPKYDYEEEVVKAIANVAGGLDEYKKAMIKFMDNKINIAGGMIMRLRGKYKLSLEAQVFYHYGYTSSEHDVVLLAWKEKVRHDRIRPTSLVQALGDEEVTPFAGRHKAKDWVPYIRVMPHAEYPSGSGCICLAVAQFIDAFLSDQYDDASIETTWDIGGTSMPPTTFGNMMDLVDACGESRLWGGMHFSASVPASYKLCDGVGKRGYNELMKPLLGTGTYAELMDDNKVKYDGRVFTSSEGSESSDLAPAPIVLSGVSKGSPSGSSKVSPIKVSKKTLSPIKDSKGSPNGPGKGSPSGSSKVSPIKDSKGSPNGPSKGSPSGSSKVSPIKDSKGSPSGPGKGIPSGPSKGSFSGPSKGSSSAAGASLPWGELQVDEAAGPSKGSPSGPGPIVPSGPSKGKDDRPSPSGPSKGSPNGPGKGNPSGPSKGSPSGPGKGIPSGPGKGSPSGPSPSGPGKGNPSGPSKGSPS